MSRKLFVTNIAAVDYEPLIEKYGTELVPMTQGYVDLTTPQGVEKLYKRIHKFLENSSPDDYLVLSGAAVISVIVYHFWVKWHKVVHVLTYNKKIASYQEITLTDADLMPNVENSP